MTYLLVQSNEGDWGIQNTEDPTEAVASFGFGEYGRRCAVAARNALENDERRLSWDDLLTITPEEFFGEEG